jgi:anti-sigma factor RsiW
MSDCQHTRSQLVAALRGRLSPAEQTTFTQHLQGCPECASIFERERELDRALERRPVFTLPEGLREQLALKVGTGRPKRRLGRVASVLAACLTLCALTLFLVRAWSSPNQALVVEAVNDHLRVLYAERPVEIESGGIHQVKPWFAGRLDFAPELSFTGDSEFPLLGGAVALFVDRKAATFIFKHRLHTATLFVFRSDGLSWPLRQDGTVGAFPAYSAASRGFNVLLWKQRDLGYALVSDMAPGALARLAGHIAANEP